MSFLTLFPLLLPFLHCRLRGKDAKCRPRPVRAFCKKAASYNTGTDGQWGRYGYLKVEERKKESRAAASSVTERAKEARRQERRPERCYRVRLVSGNLTGKDIHHPVALENAEAPMRT